MLRSRMLLAKTKLRLVCVRAGIFKHGIAMKNTSIGDGPDFHSCMEFLNFTIWLSHEVQLDFEALHQLTHHDHPTWVSAATLDMYRDLLTEARGIALGRWTYETGAVYERGLDVAKRFRIL